MDEGSKEARNGRMAKRARAHSTGGLEKTRIVDSASEIRSCRVMAPTWIVAATSSICGLRLQLGLRLWMSSAGPGVAPQGPKPPVTAARGNRHWAQLLAFNEEHGSSFSMKCLELYTQAKTSRSGQVECSRALLHCVWTVELRSSFAKQGTTFAL